MWAELTTPVLVLATGFSIIAWIRTHRKLRQVHIEREDLASSSRLIEEERQMLDLMGHGASLREVLDSLTLAIERLSPGAIATVLLLDEQHRRYLLKASGPSVPEEYLQAINGLEIGPDVGACGSAAFRNETVVVEDIATDYRFATARDFILGYGLRSCWSVPIQDSRAMVLGTFAIYHRYPSTPRAEELRMARAAAQLAGNAIERIRAEQTFRETTQRLHLAEQVAQFGIWEADLSKSSVVASDVVLAMLGRGTESGRLSFDECLSLIHPDDIDRVRSILAAAVPGQTMQHEFRILLPDGCTRWMRSLWRFDQNADPADLQPTRALGALINITEEKSIRERLENACAAAEASAAAARETGRLEQDRKTILELVAKDQPLDHILLLMASAAARHMPGSLCCIQLDLSDGSRIAVSPRVPERIAGALSSLPMRTFQETLLPRPVALLSCDAAWKEVIENSKQLMPSRYRAVPIFRNTRLTGVMISFFEESCADCPEGTPDNVLESWGQFASLAVERRGLYEQLSFRARYDSLTALLNRAALYERLEAEVTRCSQEGGSMAVLYLDLDSFKDINDQQGHSAGDAVLQNVARQILRCIRRTDMAARIGGDEFVIILPGVSDRNEATRVGDLIVSSIVESSLFHETELNPGASYGVSIFPTDGTEGDALISRADEEMYRAKARRRRDARTAAVGRSRVTVPSTLTATLPG